jgi:hypothetical protein
MALRKMGTKRARFFRRRHDELCQRCIGFLTKMSCDLAYTVYALDSSQQQGRGDAISSEFSPKLLLETVDFSADRRIIIFSYLAHLVRPVSMTSTRPSPNLSSAKQPCIPSLTSLHSSFCLSSSGSHLEPRISFWTIGSLSSCIGFIQSREVFFTVLFCGPKRFFEIVDHDMAWHK